MTTFGKFIVIILILAIVGGFVIFFRSRNGAVTEKNSHSLSLPVAVTSTPNAGVASPGSAPKIDVSRGAALVGSTVLIPQAGDAWRINEPHTIEFNKPAGVTGGVFLVDVMTKKVAGWITSAWGDNQDAFVWDTRAVFLTRDSGQKKEVQPGTYLIEVSFDKRAPDIASGIFRIVELGSPEIITYSVRLKDFTATPAVLSVRRGSKVIFINGDSKRQTISAPGFGPFVIDAGKFFSLDTATLAPGSYSYTSDFYLNRGRGTLIVE